MEKIKRSLLKRKKIGMFILLLVAILGYFIHTYYPFHPLSYVSRQWRMPLVYFLLAYKIVELGIFYFIFYHKPYQKLLESTSHTHYEEKFKINAKRFFFLVPQGSIVFGFLSYKLSGDIQFLWVFLAIAILTLLLVNPKKLNDS